MTAKNDFFFISSRFRRGFQQFFRWCPFIRISPDVLTRRGAVNSRYSCSGSPDHHRIVRNGTFTPYPCKGEYHFSPNRLESFFFLFCLIDVSDTERSILYTCPGSPKTHRRSQGKEKLFCHRRWCCYLFGGAIRLAVMNLSIDGNVGRVCDFPYLFMQLNPKLELACDTFIILFCEMGSNDNLLFTFRKKLFVWTIGGTWIKRIYF